MEKKIVALDDELLDQVAGGKSQTITGSPVKNELQNALTEDEKHKLSQSGDDQIGFKPCGKP